MKSKTAVTKNNEPVEIFIDGCGARPDGRDSGFAWIQPRTGKSALDWIDGLTNNQAEYRALQSALNALAPRTQAVIFSDSQVLSEQFNGRYAVRDPALAELLAQIRTLIERKFLTVTVKWIPRAANLADRLLKKKGTPSNAFTSSGTAPAQR